MAACSLSRLASRFPFIRSSILVLSKPNHGHNSSLALALTLRGGFCTDNIGTSPLDEQLNDDNGWINDPIIAELARNKERDDLKAVLKMRYELDELGVIEAASKAIAAHEPPKANNDNGNGNGDPWRKWKDSYKLSDDINPFTTTLESLAKSQQREKTEQVLIEKAKLSSSDAILLTQDLIDTFGESQENGFEKAVLDKIHIYGPRDGDKGDNAKDILFDDDEWKTALNDLWVKLDDEDKLVTIHGIRSRDVVAQDFRKNIQFVINKNPREMRLNEAASGVGKTTLINGLLKVIAESRSDLVAAVIPMQKIAEVLGELYDAGGFRFVPFIENALEAAYPGCIKYIIIDDIEQIFHYQWVGAFLGGLGTRTDPGDRKKYATWDFCGSSLLSHALLSKNGAYFSDKTNQEYKYWNEGIKINARRLSKTPSLTNCVSINEFKILFKSIATTLESQEATQVTLPADDDEYEWISLFWKTGGHPDTMYKLIKHQSTKDIVTNTFNKLENEIAENAEYDKVMKKVIGQYWSFWDGFGDNIHRKENESLLPSAGQSINEWFEYRANQNMAWIDPTRANGVHRSEFSVKEHVLRRMEDRGMIIVRDGRVFPAFPYFALISLREPTLEEDVKSFYSQLTKCRDEITAL